MSSPESRPGTTGPGPAAPPPVDRAPEPPAEAVEVFGDRLPLTRQYADLLATTGISHGLIGPREAARLWERHLVNCAVMSPLLREGAEMADIGSGAGLPGLVLAILRPDLRVHLIEPLQRRTTWLESTIEDLGLPNVVLHRARAEDTELTVEVVTARAVASLDKLVAWSFPLLAPGGRLLALKGLAAAQELEDAGPMLLRQGVQESKLHVLGEGRVSEPVRVVEIVRPATLRRPNRQGSTSTPGSAGKPRRPRKGARPAR